MVGQDSVNAIDGKTKGRTAALRWPVHSSRHPIRARKTWCGFSLIEVMIVLTIMGILVAASVPSFHRTIEQSRADIAGANLRAVWAAQRVYWLEYRTYTTDLFELESLGLLDPSIPSATSHYTYAIGSADDNTFSATASRSGSTRWSGQFAINEEGTASGAIQATGEADITPGFQ